MSGNDFSKLGNKRRRKTRLKRRQRKFFPRFIKPSGTISKLLAVVAGIEPLFEPSFKRRLHHEQPTDLRPESVLQAP